MKTLDVQPINEKLREINNPPGVKLIYDVINCNEPRIKKALQVLSHLLALCKKSLVRLRERAGLRNSGARSYSGLWVGSLSRGRLGRHAVPA